VLVKIDFNIFVVSSSHNKISILKEPLIALGLLRLLITIDDVPSNSGFRVDKGTSVIVSRLAERSQSYNHSK